MNRLNTYVFPLLGGVILLGASSYAFTRINRQGNAAQTPLVTQLSNTPSTVPTALKPFPASNPISQNGVTVTIYRPDSQCQALVPQKVSVLGENTVKAAVGKVLEQRNSTDFNLTGYRVSVNPKSGVAIVDMRLAPNSKRKFVSLSTCEQFALFGSLRKTLTSNQGFKIKDVRFTEQGEQISL